MKTSSNVVALAIYRPTWVDAKGVRRAGLDEDTATLAVSAGRLLEVDLAGVEQVIMVGREPDALLGTISEVVLEGLGIGLDVPVREVLGGAPELVDTLLSSVPNTLVIAVDRHAPTASAATLVGTSGGVSLTFVGRVRNSVPVTTVPLPGVTKKTYDDPRLLRERGWKRVITELDGGHDESPLWVTGLSPRDAVRLAGAGSAGCVEVGAVGPLIALVDIVESGNASARLLGLENGHGVAVRVRCETTPKVYRDERAPLEAGASQVPVPAVDLPASLAAYERAFEAKVGLKAGVCVCGSVNYPPRVRCVDCQAMDSQALQSLGRAGMIYSIVTIRVPVPGKPVPYSLAVVELDDRSVRVLAHVTDDEPGRAVIGDRGEMVLRQVAVRAGISDYGYAFRPEVKA